MGYPGLILDAAAEIGSRKREIQLASENLEQQQGYLNDLARKQRQLELAPVFVGHFGFRELLGPGLRRSCWRRFVRTAA